MRQARRSNARPTTWQRRTACASCASIRPLRFRSPNFTPIWFGSWYADENDNEARLGVYAVLPKDEAHCLPDSEYCAGEVKSVLQSSIELLSNMTEEDVESVIGPYVAYAKQYGIPIDYDHDLVTISVS